MSNDQYRSNDSSTYAGRPTAQDDLTWLDFLRTAGGTVRNDPRPTQLARTDSAERKRRHTGSEPQQRTHPHPFQTSHRPSNDSSSRIGSTRETAIDLTTPPRSARPPSNAMQNNTTSSSAARRDSDIVLPKWQPDHEATECPVCHNEFSFLYRRHHCRKCGRVVCATCSPHRITIPRQYIVQPPNPFYEDEGHPAAAGMNPALGGGEVVRVCNPCVPDPWTPDTDAAIGPRVPLAPNTAGDGVVGGISQLLSQRRERYGTRGAQLGLRNHHQPQPDERERYMQARREQRESTQAYDASPPPSPPSNRDPTTRALSTNRLGSWQQVRPNFQHPLRSWDHDPSRRPTPLPPNRPSNLPVEYSREERRFVFPTGGTVPQRRPLNQPQHSLPNPSPASPPPGMVVGAPPGRRPYLPPQPSTGPRRATLAGGTLPPRPEETPRRQVREEDECPVCHIELPPAEAIRISHIDACVASHFSSTSNQQPRSSVRGSGAVASGPPTTASNAPEGSRPRATSHRLHRMVLYVATEKDSMTEDGTLQECVICLEEFEEGQEMGRMECLCKFHRACIRGWWETKGQGSCPTHQLHD